MLRTIRITLATVLLVCITWLFLDFTGTAYEWFSWMPKLQFLEAILAVNIGVIVFLIILTLVCGRIYCSVICPLGIMQDIFGWLGKKKKKNRYTYSKEVKWLRYPVCGDDLRYRDIDDPDCIGMAQWSYVLQHHLPCWNGAEFHKPLLVPEDTIQRE